ncbi:hypothetical protein ZIOFF_048061 [Zingiber officinale]|uniref:AB hydrolase-1 domain-containing protein n=1 Tax=Zingiber officinale TaxID=94328 RepID=A0A8J5KU42_ZINOF|nr:hypothetical protein ZIOFF_048061 [Zingiber officinale]
MASTKSFRHLLLLLTVALLSLFCRVVAAARRLLSFPALLLIHDFGDNSKWQWERQIGALSRSFDLYIPDLLFFGRSRSSCADRSVGYQARCVAEVMRLLGVARYSVMGISYGGFMAFRLAEMEAMSVERVAILTAGICMSPEQLRVMSAKEKRDVCDLLLPQKADDLRALVSRCSSIIHQTNKLYDTQDSVTVVGYPLGGDTISVTKGVVSRIEYAHGSSDLLGIQIDAAINLVVVLPSMIVVSVLVWHSRIVFNGNASESEDTENIRYVIPTTVVSHFLDDYERNGKCTENAIPLIPMAILIKLLGVQMNQIEPKMGQVVRMLDSDEPIPREDRRHRRNCAGNTEIDSQRDSSDTDKSDNPDSRYSSRKNRPASSRALNSLANMALFIISSHVPAVAFK